MKKVLFTATVDSHINHFHLPYLKLFKDNGYEVHVATNTDEPIEYCDVKHKVSFERSPFKINNLKAIKQLEKILNEEKFDIIHTHTPMGSVVTRIAAIKTRKENRTRVIYTVHGFHFYKGAPILNWLLFYPVEKILSKYTDTLITINNEDYELAKKKFTKTNVEYVPGVGVDENKFNFEMTEEEKIKLREEVGCNKDDFVIIYTAELNKNKNQIMAIEAIRELVKENINIHLLLVGQGNLREYYEEKVKEYNLQNNIHFLGYRNDVPRLLKISNLAISTSKREGLPVNIIEAMICRLPVIVTSCRGNRDLVEDGNNGYLVKNEDDNNLKDKLVNIIKSDEIQTKFSNNSTGMSNKYLFDNISINMGNIYNLNKIQSNTPLRVLHCIRGMNVGGAETFIMNVYRNIDRKIIQFDFLVSKDGYFDDEIKTLGGKIYKIPYLTEIGQFRYSKFLREFFRKHKKYKIVHSHIDQVTGIIIEAANKENVPFRIAHSHSTKNSNNTLAKIYKIYLQSKINKNATNLFACSRQAANWLFTNRSNEAEIINNGIDIEEFKFSNGKRKLVRNKLNISEDTIVIGHVGAFRRGKNHEFLIDTFNKYQIENNNSVLILVGDGQLRESIESKVKKLKLTEKVKFLGIVDNMGEIYSSFDLFLFPSQYEGLGIALIEAQISGLKCITSFNVPREVDISNNVEFVKDFNIDNWVDLIIEKNERDRDKEYLRLEKTDYNIKEVVNKVQSLYLEINNG